MLSIAAAAIVTRVASSHDLAGQIGSQFGSARTWTPVAVILALLGVLPGMPHLIILPAAIAAGAFAWKLNRDAQRPAAARSEEHTSELQSLMRTSYAVFCLKKKHQLHAWTPTLLIVLSLPHKINTTHNHTPTS